MKNTTLGPIYSRNVNGTLNTEASITKSPFGMRQRPFTTYTLAIMENKMRRRKKTTNKKKQNKGKEQKIIELESPTSI